MPYCKTIIFQIPSHFRSCFLRPFFDENAVFPKIRRTMVERWSNKLKIDQKYESYLSMMNRGLARFLFCYNTIIE